MKLSPLAERLIAKADANRKSASAANGKGRTDAIPATVQISPSLAKYPVNMKVREAAEYLGISCDQVMGFRDLGVLTFINIAPRGATRPTWRIDQASVAAFETQRTTRQ